MTRPLPARNRNALHVSEGVDGGRFLLRNERNRRTGVLLRCLSVGDLATPAYPVMGHTVRHSPRAGQRLPER